MRFFGVADPDLELGHGLVWARLSELLVVGIDPKTGLVARRVTTASLGGGYLAVDAASIWEPASLTDSVFRHPL